MNIEGLLDTVTGYGNGFERARQESALSALALKELLLNHNVEQCPCCHWYTDSHELLDEDGRIDGHCDNCRRFDKQRA